jgi:cellulose synthase/poly-beta-1,6-N-acetylglucosamine synthase-like glycosyltransferase
VNLKREMFWTRVGILVTLLATGFVYRDIGHILRDAAKAGRSGIVFEEYFFLFIISILVYGNLLYQMTRIGYFRRLLKHQPASPYKLDRFYQDGLQTTPSLTVLIPSYKEEARVVKQTVLSAALQSYPKRRVVLLVDDPPFPKAAEDREKLDAARRIPQEIQALFAPLARRFEEAESRFTERLKKPVWDAADEHVTLMQHYYEVLRWFRERAASFAVSDHTDRLFIEMTYGKRVQEFEKRIQELDAGLRDSHKLFSEKELCREFRRLATLFRVEVSTFERKAYENLSHESNKAMNLNSYISLMGKSYEEEMTEEKVYLAASSSSAARHFPDSDYLITLDADSLLDSDYALRLIYFMEQPGNEKFAVVQTPYSAVPDAPGILERTAGATTDMQYLIHQGFTRHRATFWVGANALLRKKALNDIAVTEKERGHVITKYIQDRTVIEDTESSVDMIERGWQLYNFPERLSFSATPPDFGALLIQRQRWANGGLIILPKLLRYFFTSGFKAFGKMKEMFMRFHYLSSISGVNVGILVLLLFPFENNMRCFWLPLTAVPYYYFYWRDLKMAGYGTKDLFRVYVMNLFLIPVNLSGVIKSIVQGTTGRKIPFKRTPKTVGRTNAPLKYVVYELLILAYCAAAFVLDVFHRRWFHALFSFGTTLCFVYAVTRFLDLGGILSTLRQPETLPVPAGDPSEETVENSAAGA